MPGVNGIFFDKDQRYIALKSKKQHSVKESPLGTVRALSGESIEPVKSKCLCGTVVRPPTEHLPFRKSCRTSVNLFENVQQSELSAGTALNIALRLKLDANRKGFKELT